MFKPLPLRVLLANCPRLTCQTVGQRVNLLKLSPQQSIVGFSPRACSYHTTVRVNGTTPSPPTESQNTETKNQSNLNKTEQNEDSKQQEGTPKPETQTQQDNKSSHPENQQSQSSTENSETQGCTAKPQAEGPTNKHHTHNKSEGFHNDQNHQNNQGKTENKDNNQKNNFWTGFTASAAIFSAFAAGLSGWASWNALRFSRADLTNELYQEYTDLKNELSILMDLKKEFFVFLEEKEKKEKDAVSDPGTKTKDPCRLSQGQTDHEMDVKKEFYVHSLKKDPKLTEKKLNEFVHKKMEKNEKTTFQQWYRSAYLNEQVKANEVSVGEIKRQFEWHGEEVDSEAKKFLKFSYSYSMNRCGRRDDIEKAIRKINHFSQRILILEKLGMLNEELVRKLVSRPTILPRAVEIADAVLTDESYRDKSAVKETEASFVEFNALCKRMEERDEKMIIGVWVGTAGGTPRMRIVTP